MDLSLRSEPSERGSRKNHARTASAEHGRVPTVEISQSVRWTLTSCSSHFSSVLRLLPARPLRTPSPSSETNGSRCHRAQAGRGRPSITMAVIQWLILAVIAYFAHSTYQRIQLTRKKAEFVRDRRRAAGIPDDDQRPFAVARADALSRRSQQKKDEVLSTPTKKRTSALTPSRSQSNLDYEAAARLSAYLALFLDTSRTVY